jgi:hypothetical protein
MRTLLDLLDDERGYVRIFSDRDGFGYELSTYDPTPITDLFERMSGYRSQHDASIAAQHQLSSIHQTLRRRRRK